MERLFDTAASPTERFVTSAGQAVVFRPRRSEGNPLPSRSSDTYPYPMPARGTCRCLCRCQTGEPIAQRCSMCGAAIGACCIGCTPSRVMGYVCHECCRMGNVRQDYHVQMPAEGSNRHGFLPGPVPRIDPPVTAEDIADHHVVDSSAVNACPLHEVRDSSIENYEGDGDYPSNMVR